MTKTPNYPPPYVAENRCLYLVSKGKMGMDKHRARVIADGGVEK